MLSSVFASSADGLGVNGAFNREDTMDYAHCIGGYVAYSCNFVYNNGQTTGIDIVYLENTKGEIKPINSFINNW